MKAIVHDVFGGPDVLRLDDVPVPEPAAGRVRVRVAAASLNMADWHGMTGLPLVGRIAFGFRRPRSRVRGMDVAGVVEAVGPGVERLAVGDEVFGVATGSFAEYAIARERDLVPLPAGVGPESAAAVPIAALTALEAVRAGEVGDGTRVLVTGAGGGVGHFAVHLAASRGAGVVGVCSTAKVALVRSLGADAVLDYTRDRIPDAAFDVVIDLGGGRPVAELRRAAVSTGVVLLTGGEDGGRWLGSTARQLTAGFAKPRVRTVLSLTRLADLEELAALLGSGTIRPAIDRVIALADVPSSMADLGAGRVLGKRVVRLG